MGREDAETWPVRPRLGLIQNEAVLTHIHWQRANIMNATVIAYGSFVVMKQIDARNEELNIALWFSAERQCSDPENHCVPVQRVLSDPKEPGWAIIVMPLLREYGKPRFDTIGETIGFFMQIFEVSRLVSPNFSRC